MTGFVPYPYIPQSVEGSAQVAQGPVVGSGEGAGFSRGPFSYITGDTSTGLITVGFIDRDGAQTVPPTSPSTVKTTYVVMEKFLCIPSDGTLAAAQLMVLQNTPQDQGGGTFPQRILDRTDVAAAFSVSIVQIDRRNVRRSPVDSGHNVLYGPERFDICNHSPVQSSPVGEIQPGIPMYLRIVAVPTLVSTWTSDDIYEGRPPTYSSVPAFQGFAILYSIPISVARVAK